MSLLSGVPDSSFWSPYHKWFMELGYPLLDIVKYPDGEWAILQCFSQPVVPSVTKWQIILKGMRNVDITMGFIEKYVAQIDPAKGFKDREEQRSKIAEESYEAKERHAEELANKATEAVIRNPDLSDRIVRNGMQELNLGRIRQHIPGYLL